MKNKTAQFQLRLPQSLKSAVEQFAAKDGVSMNQFLVVAASEKLASLKSADDLIQERRKRGDKEAALTFLYRNGGEEPDMHDRS